MIGAPSGVRYVSLLLISLALSACGVLPPARVAIDQSVEAYGLAARFGLRDNGQSYHGRLHWQHNAGEDRVLVQDPLGGGLAELIEDSRGARMTLASGDVSEAADAPQLMQKLTGIALPVRSVARWLTGRALPPAGVERDALGRPQHFSVDGWHLRYEYEASGPNDADLLPSRIFAGNGRGIDLRLAVDTWILGSTP